MVRVALCELLRGACAMGREGDAGRGGACGDDSRGALKVCLRWLKDGQGARISRRCNKAAAARGYDCFEVLPK